VVPSATLERLNSIGTAQDINPPAPLIAAEDGVERTNHEPATEPIQSYGTAMDAMDGCNGILFLLSIKDPLNPCTK
jgi:hypothetical protein